MRGRGLRLPLFELMIAVCVLVVGLVFTSRSIIVSTQLASTGIGHRDRAARRMIEVPGETFAGLRTLRPGHFDDPGGAGTAPGPNFVIAGLQPLKNDADGCVGEIVLPTVSGAGSILREDVVDLSLGTPRDLNLDGVTDGGNHALDYRILPVLVRLRWRGEHGPQEIVMRTILGGL